MKFKICWADHRFTGKFDRLTAGIIDVLRSHGHIVTEYPEPDYDFIINGSYMHQRVYDKWAMAPDAKLVSYCWDWYPWVIKDPKRDMRPYADLLRKSAVVLCPNQGTKIRLKELSGIEARVVKFSIPVYEVDKISNEKFVLDPVRYYPERNVDWIEKACSQLSIPCKRTEHQLTQEEFRNLVGTCSMVTCGYLEASTGGLSLIEGLWLGKPALVSDSPLLGAKEYLGEWGNYFDHNDFEDLKVKIKDLWDNPPEIDITKARKYITDNFSDEALYRRLYPILCELKH